MSCNCDCHVNLGEVKILAEHNLRVYGTVGRRNEETLKRLDPAFLRYLLSKKDN